MPRIKIAAPTGEPVELHYEDHGNGRPVVLIHEPWNRPLPGRGDSSFLQIEYWTGIDRIVCCVYLSVRPRAPCAEINSAIMLPAWTLIDAARSI